jgi:chromosome segregation ATPase
LSRPTVKTRYCADLIAIKNLFDTHIDPLCSPIVHLLSEDMQVILSERIEFLELSKASCVFAATILALICTAWLALLHKQKKSKQSTIQVLNMRLVALDSDNTKLIWERDTYKKKIVEQEEKLAQVEASEREKEAAMSELNEKYQDLLSEHGELAQNIEENGAAESKLQTELTRITREMSELREDHERIEEETQLSLAQVKASLNERDGTIEQLTSLYQSALGEHARCQTLVSENCAMKAEVEKLTQTVEILKSTLAKQMAANASSSSSSRNSTHILTNGHHDPNSSANCDETVAGGGGGGGDESIVSVDSVMQIAQLQFRVRELEEAQEARACDASSTAALLAEKERSLDALKAKLCDSEQKAKMAIEMRAQDIKHHVKAMNEMETQLKKKCTEAEKVTHLLEQIKLKQERLQDLESQFARIERQSNQERQTYEKQAHENWLNNRKVDKELKETKVELSSMKGLLGFFP